MLYHASLYGLCVDDSGPSSWIVSVNSMLAPARTAEMSAVNKKHSQNWSTVHFISVSGQFSSQKH